MNLEFFIAKKVYFNKSKKGNKNVSTPAVKIAVGGVALAVATMILAVAIVFGFKNEVRNKIIGFGGHIQIENYENNTSYEKLPIALEDSLIQILNRTEGVKHLETYIAREGIIKTDDNFQGVIFKGIGSDFDWTFFQKHLKEGSVLNSDSLQANQAMISSYISRKLGLNVGDSFLAYFFQEKIQPRKFHIVGIYNTNFENYDKLYVLTDLKVLQRLNKWSENEVTGIELIINDFDRLEQIKDEIFFEMIVYKDQNNNNLYTRSIKEINPYLFDWLSLMDMNVWVIIILMFVVSGVTMSSGILILILEQTNMIGLLKSLGYSNKKLRRVFLFVSSFLILRGMFWGNACALLIVAIQKLTGVMRLNPDTYYVSEVPIEFNIWYVVVINVLVLLISTGMMIAPTYLISKIRPAKSIKFE